MQENTLPVADLPLGFRTLDAGFDSQREYMKHNHIVPNFRPDTCPACAKIVQDIQDAFDKKEE